MIDRRRRRLRSTVLAGGRVIPRVALVGFWKTYDSVSGTFPDKYGQYPITATGQTGPYFEAGATYTMANNATLRGLLGHTDGAASTFYGADNLPVAVSYYTLVEFAVGPRLFYNPDKATKGLALYSADKDDTGELKVWKALGTAYALPTPTAFFNGIDTTGMTSFTGGSTTFSDVNGKLQIAPTNTMAKTGMRVATTVAEGATISGTDFITQPLNLQSGYTAQSSASITAYNTYTTATKSSYVRPNTALTLGKRYKLVVAGTGPFRVRDGATGVDLLLGFGEVEFVANDIYKVQLSATGAGTVIISSLSLREVLPTYYDTTLSGANIVDSVSQVTRTGDANFQVFTTNPAVKRYSTSNPLTMPGYLSEPARTNKCTCMKRNPTATTNITKSGDAAAVLSVVNDAAALATAGLDKICTSGNVYKLDNSAGSTTVYAEIAGANGNTNQHYLSVYGRRNDVAGANNLINSVTPYTGVPFDSNTVWKRYIVASVNDAGNKLQIRAGAGQIIYFILPQLEEGAFATSPICQLDQTAAETRAATVLTYPTAGKIRSNNMAFRMIVVPRATGQSGELFRTYTDANNHFGIQYNAESGGRIYFTKRKSGTSTDAFVSHTQVVDVPVEIIAATTATYGMVVSFRTFSGGAWSAFTNGTPVTTSAAKEAAIIASTFQLGASNSVTQFTGNISLFDTLPIPTGVNDPLAWAKQQWGIA